MTTAEVDQKLVAYDYLECRTLGHAWTIVSWGLVGPDSPPITKAWKWDKVRVSKCLRCQCVRDEFYPAHTISPWESWRVQIRRYHYPVGYQQRGPERHDRTEYTAAAYLRLSGT